MVNSPSPLNDPVINQTIDLLEHYGFDLGSTDIQGLITHLLQQYPGSWIRLAVIEAIYQGRSKTVAIERILSFWLRKSRVVCHFSGEFERLVCGNIPTYAVPFVIGPHSESAVTIPPRPPEEDALKALVNPEAEVCPSPQNDYRDTSTKDLISSHEINHQTPQLPLDRPSNPELSTQASKPVDIEIEKFTPIEDGSPTYSKLVNVANDNQPP